MTAAQTSRRDRTRQRLMSAGERLIGVRGIDGVSLEEIARAAGQANKYAVQYHFGSREGLIQQILDTRMAAIEARRAEILPDTDLSDVAAIIAAFITPLAELAADGAAFPRFLLQFATQFQPWPDIIHPLENASNDTAALVLFRALCAALPHVPPDILGRRLMLAMHLPLHKIVADAVDGASKGDGDLRDLIGMMRGALAAPVDEKYRLQGDAGLALMRDSQH